MWQAVAGLYLNRQNQVQQEQDANKKSAVDIEAKRVDSVLKKRAQRQQAADAIQPQGQLNIDNLISGVFTKKNNGGAWGNYGI